MSSNGKWHAFKNTGDKTEESYGELGKGVFLKQGKKLHFVSAYSAERPVVSEDELMASPDFLRVDSVLGYKAIVVSSGNRRRTSSEFYKVPALGGEIIKTVLADSATGPKIIFEPLSLTIGEPEPAAVAMPRDLPVDYETLKAKRTTDARTTDK